MMSTQENLNVFASIAQAMAEHITNHFNVSYQSQYRPSLNADLQRTDFGDMSCQAPFLLAKELRRSPTSIAQELANTFKHPLVIHCTVAGNGFVNLELTQTAFIQASQELQIAQHNFFKTIITPRKSYSVEFVSANPTGPLHIGHGRGGIVGDVLCRVLTFLNNQVISEFYINDAGSQIEKLAKSLHIRILQQLEIPASLDDSLYQGEYLIPLAQEYIAQHGAENSKNADFESLGRFAQEHLLHAIKQTLIAYGIQYDLWFSEKSLHDSGAIDAAVQFLQQRGFIYEQDGALWLRTTDFGDDKDRVVKRAGEGQYRYTYVAADIAYLLEKLKRADMLIMVLGQDHHSYVVRLKAILAACGYNPELLTVILYQLVTINESGQEVRLSKRAGRIVSLKDCIDAVGKDVARFFYLNRKVEAHLDLNLEQALKRTDDNPVFYIQYAYVRLKSMLAKAKLHEELSNPSIHDAVNLSHKEHLIIKKIASLADLLSAIEHHYQTHHLSYYAYELAHTIHTYYAHTKVIDLQDIPLSRARLLVVRNALSTFELLFNLLGMDTIDQM